MSKLHPALWLGLGLAVACTAGVRQPGDETAAPAAGVLVEEVTAESLGARAGLRADDLLVSWCRTAASPDGPCLAAGKFQTPFDFETMEIEEAPRGGVRILGKRAAVSTTWVLLPGSQSVKVRPVLPADLLALYQEGRGLAGTEPLDAAVERWRSAVLAAKQAGDGRLAVWLLSRAAGALAEARKWPPADALYRTAAEQARLPGAAKLEACIAKAWGKTFQRRGSWREAEDLFRRSLELDQNAEPQGLAVAWDLHTLGTMSAQHSALATAEDHLRRALAIRERLAPRSSSLAGTLMNLGNVLQLRGDLIGAEDTLRRALSIQEELAPGSAEVADILLNLGAVVGNRGNIAGAEELYRRAKAIYERIKPEGLEIAKILKNLSDLAVNSYDEGASEYFLQQALAIEEKRDPSGAGLAITLENLGLQALDRGNLEKAEEYLRRALSLEERLEPEGLAFARGLKNLGVVALQRQDCAMAEADLQRALAIQQRLSPESIASSHTLQALGERGLQCGDLAAAETHYRHALAIREKIAPDTSATLLHGLGLTLRRRSGTPAAVEALCAAVDAAEKISWERNARVATQEASFFADCLAARVELGQAAEAFHVLERGRARAFLRQLAERDLLLAANLPAELARRKTQLNQELESVQGALARLTPAQDAAEVEHLLNRMRETQDRQRELTVQIRRSSPRLASLQYPEPLDLAGARRILDAGTVLLSYAVGEEESYLFVVQPSGLAGAGLAVFRLPIGAKPLREAIASLNNLLQDAYSDPAALAAQARRLYALLIGPAEPQIAAAKRLLVLPDGPLHTLPFAALIRKDRYLVEWKPVHFVLSATVYAELKKARRPPADPAPGQVVAFGDPVYPPLSKDRDAAPAATLEILTAVRRGLSLKPIPATRREVEAIASLYPQAETYLGGEATEERVKSLGSEARLVHFACHGLLDERVPLNSALALAIPEHPAPGQDNGLLQAWEILESVRLDADLVTLSACDTALGKEMGGEGLVGLTRAFQFAGARSVLASLWSISDVSTANFMKRFYGYLHGGKTKDEALRAAQIDQIRGRSGSRHPFHWAAFELFGDWR